MDETSRKRPGANRTILGIPRRVPRAVRIPAASGQGGPPTLLAAIALAGCLRQVPPGPELGACADIPEGAYSYGEVGIGSCLAGPADLRFFEQDGATFLAVTNADPYRTYLTGSVLVIDWTDLATRLEND